MLTTKKMSSKDFRPRQGVYVVDNHELKVGEVLQCNPPLKVPLIAVRICGDGKTMVCHTDQVFSNRKDAQRWLRSQE